MAMYDLFSYGLTKINELLIPFDYLVDQANFPSYHDPKSDRDGETQNAVRLSHDFLCRCHIGRRLIEGVIKEKEDASATYHAAVN